MKKIILLLPLKSAGIGPILGMGNKFFLNMNFCRNFLKFGVSKTGDDALFMCRLSNRENKKNYTKTFYGNYGARQNGKE